MKHAIYLAFSFAKRDLRERYVGTGLGQLWYVLSPIISIFIYTVIFSDFMKMKLDLVQSNYAYSIYLISALLAWSSFSTLLMRLNGSLTEKAHLIKKISVPPFVYQLAIALGELAVLLLSYLFACIFLLLVEYPLTWTFFYLLPLFVLQTVFGFSLGVIFSLFTPFFKDLKEAIPVIVQLWFWVTPIIYLQEMIEQKYPLLLRYNPFYHFAHCYQEIFLYSRAPSIEDLLTLALLSFVPFVTAVFLYKKMIGTIKDII